MKYVVIFLISFLLLSCSDNASDNKCRTVEYGETIELKVSDKVCFPDGNWLMLDEIKHEFCPCGAICAWEGDLNISIRTSTGENEVVSYFYPSRLEFQNEVFDDHSITSAIYTYGEDESVPECAEDFEQEKMNLFLIIEQN